MTTLQTRAIILHIPNLRYMLYACAGCTMTILHSRAIILHIPNLRDMLDGPRCVLWDETEPLAKTQ